MVGTLKKDSKFPTEGNKCGHLILMIEFMRIAAYNC